MGYLKIDKMPKWTPKQGVFTSLACFGDLQEIFADL